MSDSPFSNMYSSFDLFGRYKSASKKRFLQISAGSNWIDACPSVLSCLHAELDSELTYRNYGRSAGMSFVTNAIEVIENELFANSVDDLSVTLTNGAAEGARLTFEFLFSADSKEEKRAVLVGPVFPLYSHLCEMFSLEYDYILPCETKSDNFLPDMADVIETIIRKKPKLVCLLVPNNPIGASYSESELSCLADVCLSCSSLLLVDRVCFLPWDNYGKICRPLSKILSAGLCIVVDSFSKSESLAGLRTGYLVSNAKIRDELLNHTRCWWLNPMNYSAVTLAFTRLAMPLVNKAEVSCLNESQILQAGNDLLGELMRSEGMGGESTCQLQDNFEQLLELYPEETRRRKETISKNYSIVVSKFGEIATRRIDLEFGFNVALELPTMLVENEQDDQRKLAKEMQVGILTENCFLPRKLQRRKYFVRIGLAMQADLFEEGLDRFAKYYAI